ncbi:MAG: GntR family transcriptional regulator [Thermosynechococcaceae cyanobacterium MS004]|nr:GntR family transcriptional regulator [Thermosynechococcaceae cyanobacterium MS004]
MVEFHIQTESEIPASTQLFSQICFAIASRQFPPGYRLPSTRQLAMQTGLHRNTISKVYERLATAGFVEAHMGSGIFVRVLGQEVTQTATPSQTPLREMIEQSLDGFLQQGHSLHQIRDLFLRATDERLRASTQLIVTVPRHDVGAGEIMLKELQTALSIPVQLIFLEDLDASLSQQTAATLVTVRYFASQAETVLKELQTTHPSAKAFRIIPIDIYSYQQELSLIQSLKPGSRLGLVSLSAGTLGVAEVMIYSVRGEDIYVMTAQCQDVPKLRALIKQAQTIICDQASCKIVKQAIAQYEEDLIRIPKVVCCQSYIDPNSIEVLRRELGLDS